MRKPSKRDEFYTEDVKGHYRVKIYWATEKSKRQILALSIDLKLCLMIVHE